MDIDSPTAFNLTSWKGYVAKKLCYAPSDACTTDWETWLSITGLTSLYTYLDFLVLLVCYLNYFFLT